MPACVADFNWGGNFLTLGTEEAWGKSSLKDVLMGLDDDEFNLFLARVVIKASGMGVVGVDLTAKVAWLKELKSR